MIARSERAEEEEVASMGGEGSREPSEHEHGSVHTPVLVSQVLRALEPLALARHGWVVDCTLGAGGHARAVLDAFPSLSVLGIDQDPDALAEARRTLAGFEDRAILRRGRMSQMAELCADESVSEIVGVLFDLGANSLHFDRPERGFSLQADGPLDMRMDPTRDRTAADIVNRWDEADLADLFYYEGGERRSRRIAQAIVEERGRVPFLRTGSLAELVVRATGERGGRIHPATKVFQALRRAVNEEGEELMHALQAAEALLANGGRLVALTFHSGEDGMVKRFLTEGTRGGRWGFVAKKPVGPTGAERLANPRSRSARMRAAQRVRSTAPHGRRSAGERRS